MSDLQSFISWWIIVTIFGLAAWPMVFRLFSFLPDRGYSLTKTAGLLAVGYVGWLLGNFQFVMVDAGGVMAALFIVVAVSLAAARGHWDDMRAWWRDQPWVVLVVELLFVIAFGVWAYARAFNPTITATEKPMEFAFLNSVLRTGAQPPGDPWLAGYAISYYHFGYVIVGMLTGLSGALPSVAFNLAVALLFGLTAVGAFGVVLNMVAAAQRLDLHKQQPSIAASIFPALLGPLFVLMGNLNGVLEVAHNAKLFAVNEAQAQTIAACPSEGRYCLICREEAIEACAKSNYGRNFWGWLDIKWTNNPPTIKPVTATTEAQSTEQQDLIPDRFLWWWQSSRVVHDRDLFGNEVEVIDEFPFFSFLLGDLHPHVLGLPFVFLAIAFALNLFLMAQAGADKASAIVEGNFIWRAWNLAPLTWPYWLSGAIIFGGLSFLNTWDFPIYVFLSVAAYGSALMLREGWTTRVWRDGVALGIVFVVLGALLYAPFYIGFRSQLGGMLPNVIFGTRVQQFVVMFGPSLSILLVFLGWLAASRKVKVNWNTGAKIGLWILFGLILLSTLLTVIGFALYLFASGESQLKELLIERLGENFRIFLQRAIDAANSLIGSASLQDAPGLILRRRLEIERLLTPLLLTGILIVVSAVMFGARRQAGSDEEDRPVRPESIPVVWFALALVGIGALFVLGPEFVYLRDLFGTRMNTIFKFYYQAWVLWSLAAAFAVWLITRAAGPTGRLVFGAGVAVVITAGLVFPTLATTTITDNWQGTTARAVPDGPDENLDPDLERYATLDGMAYMMLNRSSDYDAIRFLNTIVKGRPVIAEAVGGSYSEYARVAAHTGLPTVLGWPWHETQWRGSGDAFAG
ncbi:MAG TPA: DUF2298 domain-containing protein, partial [Anaerolineales bacterium]|nr:DUF2298 domain-containing protein [Anaerolineales bacterium]